jgi:hypothetical protein
MKRLSGRREEMNQFLIHVRGYSRKKALREIANDLCMDCGVDTYEIGHYYMIHEELWLSINPKDSGQLCLDCVECRLGRKLTRVDFTKAPINDHELLGLLN